MCVVSFVGDHYRDQWQPQPWYPGTTGSVTTIISGITREEFEALKAEVAEMKELLKAAKRIDELTGQPDCEMDEKLEVLRRVAEMVGINLEDVLG